MQNIFTDQNIKLAELLVDNQLFNKSKINKILANCGQHYHSLASYLLAERGIDRRLVLSIIAQAFDLPLIEINKIDLTAIPDKLLASDIIKQHLVLPVKLQHHKLWVAIADPSRLQGIEKFRLSTGLQVYPVLCDKQALIQAIDGLLTKSFTSIEVNINNDDVAIIKFINQLLKLAIFKQASDIHFEPYVDYYRIRFRIDGHLLEMYRPEINLANLITVRLKIISQLDIAEKRIPQDGSFQLIIDDKKIDFRINTCPVCYGEKIVVRILDYDSQKIAIDQLGFTEWQQNFFLQQINKSQGMILVTGPTGSGKTITLYSVLNLLNRIEKNIVTAEDPIEIKLSGINQVAINHKIKLNFAAVLRALLRQDPDIIMLGEIRDAESAEIAIKAAQTGHLVLSSLHNRYASSAISRLIGMGVKTYNIVDAVSLIIAQRLVRKLCSYCKVAIDGSIYAANHSGCQYCHQGYHGRVAIFEFLPITTENSKLIGNQNNLAKLSPWKLDLYAAGMQKVQQGITSANEINRII